MGVERIELQVSLATAAAIAATPRVGKHATERRLSADQTHSLVRALIRPPADANGERARQIARDLNGSPQLVATSLADAMGIEPDGVTIVRASHLSHT